MNSLQKQHKQARCRGGGQVALHLLYEIIARGRVRENSKCTRVMTRAQPTKGPKRDSALARSAPRRRGEPKRRLAKKAKKSLAGRAAVLSTWAPPALNLKGRRAAARGRKLLAAALGGEAVRRCLDGAEWVLSAEIVRRKSEKPEAKSKTTMHAHFKGLPK